MDDVLTLNNAESASLSSASNSDAETETETEQTPRAHDATTRRGGRNPKRPLSLHNASQMKITFQDGAHVVVGEGGGGSGEGGGEDMSASLRDVRSVLKDRHWFDSETAAAADGVRERPVLDTDLHAALLVDSKEEALARAAHYIEVALTERKVQLGGLTPFERRLYLLRKQWWYLWFIRLNILLQLSLVLIEPVSHRSSETDHSQFLAEVIIGSFSVSVQLIDVVVRAYPFGWSHFKEPWNSVNFAVVAVNGLDILFRLAGVSSFRFSRMFRPLLLIAQSRRLRQTFWLLVKSMPAILGVISIFAMVTACYAHLGVMLFQGIYEYGPDEIPAGNFDTWSSAMLALFWLITTENYPAILYPAFEVSNYATIYFVSFIMVHFILMALLLAVVYDSYTEEHKNHIVSSLVKEKRNFYLAFHCIDRDNSGYVDMTEWEDLLRVIRPDLDEEQSRLMFALLDTDGDGELNVEEFALLADMLTWKFERVPERDVWQRLWDSIASALGVPLALLYIISLSRPFEYVYKAGILINAVLHFVYVDDNLSHNWSFVFLAFLIYFTVALFIKLCGRGYQAFVASAFNVWDSFIVATTWVLYIVYQANGVPHFYNITCFLLPSLWNLRQRHTGVIAKILAIDERFDSFLTSARQSASIFFSLFIIILLLQYAYAIMGMEMFAGVHKEFNPPYDNPHANFDSFGSAMLTLTQMDATNNLNEQSNYYCAASGNPYASWYWITYWTLITSCMLDLFISLVTEAFTRTVDASEASATAFLLQDEHGESLKVRRRRRWSRELVKKDLTDVDRSQLLVQARDALKTKLEHHNQRSIHSIHSRNAAYTPPSTVIGGVGGEGGDFASERTPLFGPRVNA